MLMITATRRAVRAATWLTEADRGAIALLEHLAKQLDGLDQGLNSGGRLDNVSAPTYLKVAESLGLTPAGRRAKDGAAAASGGGEIVDELDAFRRRQGVGR